MKDVMVFERERLFGFMKFFLFPFSFCSRIGRARGRTRVVGFSAEALPVSKGSREVATGFGKGRAGPTACACVPAAG